MRNSPVNRVLSSRRGLTLLAAAALLLCVLLLAGAIPALADAGGFPTPTPTFTLTPIPTITLTPTWTPVPTVIPTSALLAPPSPTALVFEDTTAQVASSRQPVSGPALGGVLCVPFAAGLLLIAALVAAVIFRPTPP